MKTPSLLLLMLTLLSTLNFYAQYASNSSSYIEINNEIERNRLELESKIVGKTTMPALYKFKSEKLILNGAGLKKHNYACGLYLEVPSTDAFEIVEADAFMILRMDIIAKSIEYKKLVKVFKNAYEDTNDEEVKFELKDELEYFLEAMEGENVKEGDKVDITYEPQKGLSLYVNYEKKVTIKGLELKRAIFNIWFSNRGIDKRLKEELLNGAQSFM